MLALGVAGFPSGGSWAQGAERVAQSSPGAGTASGPVDDSELLAGADELKERVRGMLLGTLIGDSAGGPVEFQPLEEVYALDQPNKRWLDDEVMDEGQLEDARNRLVLRPYSPLRPHPEPYGHWSADAPPGCVTDDSRHKMILLHLLRQCAASGALHLDENSFAKAYLDWPLQPSMTDRPHYAALIQDWLREMQFSARWVLGERDLNLALPPERMWVGLPTCCGQMALPPLAAVFAGRPLDAYLAAYAIDFIDNSFARDMNSALVAGLSAALTIKPDQLEPSACWRRVVDAMYWTDPYRYGEVLWSERASVRWMGVAKLLVQESGGKPKRFFDALTREFKYTTKWEAQVPFVVMFGCLELCRYDPLASLQLTMEWGEDADSYPQLLGAFLGALYGPELFPEAMRNTVENRLAEDYGESIEEWVQTLLRCQELASA